METFTIATIITTVGTMLTGVLGWVGDVITFAVGQPILLFAGLSSIVYGIIRKGVKVVKKRTI